MRWRRLDFRVIGDERGMLLPIEGEDIVPFAIQRVYCIYDTMPNVRRGMHAHRHLQQVAIALAGSCTFLLDDGFNREEIHLDALHNGIYMGSIVWREMYNFSEDCVLMVLADQHYDNGDYIRDYHQFVAEAKAANGRGEVSGE